MAYEWLNDLPTNPPVPGEPLPTRNTAQPATQQYSNSTENYQPKDGDWILEAEDYGGLMTKVTREGSPTTFHLSSNQAALEFIAWTQLQEGSTNNIFLRQGALLLPMKTS